MAQPELSPQAAGRPWDHYQRERLSHRLLAILIPGTPLWGYLVLPYGVTWYQPLIRALTRSAHPGSSPAIAGLHRVADQLC